jgi:hypothetical protein
MWQVADLSSTACGRLINTAKALGVLLLVETANVKNWLRDKRRIVMSIKTAPKTTEQYFHPVEHLILSEYFGVEPPDCARQEGVEELLEKYSRTFISLKPDESGETTENDNAVARLLLHHIQESLPQWASICLTTGEISFGRDFEEPKENHISLLPQHVFGLNWADTAPGISWPVEYYVTFVPYYERYVVTGSEDSPDASGYCDLPIGHFGSDIPLLEGVKEVICADWREMLEDGGQQRWAESWFGALISSDESERWADEVWFDPTRCLTNLLEDDEDSGSTRHEVLSEQEREAIKEALDYLPDYSDC